ncbi:phosphotransferase family protein [Microlunatus speluncae]|uniref:phosphotransferase family protein n=1 Tax=Microlunatus speluncae TaxID=2594267 RepID=UPI00126651B2|nr:aminoglycoside phosphotransferase family protein [Microlunatus speluncae]
MTESRFLAHLHAQFATPREQVAALVHRVTGSEVAATQRIVRGYDNEVYRVDLEPSTRVFVRIRRRPGGFDDELWAMAQARDHGVPVPEVIGVDEVPDERGPRAAMVITPAPGRQLKELLPSLGPAERRAVLTDLGRVIDRLHQIRTPGVWRPDDDGRWPDPAGVRHGYIRDRRAEHDRLAAAGLTPTELEQTLAALEPSLNPPAADFVLCHGDLSPEHVFVAADHSVSCLIDWGMWHGGSALGEFAYLSTTFAPDDLATILEGQGRQLDDDLRRTIATATVSLQIGHIAHHVTIGDRDGTDQNVAQLRRALATLHPPTRH